MSNSTLPTATVLPILCKTLAVDESTSKWNSNGTDYANSGHNTVDDETCNHKPDNNSNLNIAEAALDQTCSNSLMAVKCDKDQRAWCDSAEDGNASKDFHNSNAQMADISLTSLSSLRNVSLGNNIPLATNEFTFAVSPKTAVVVPLLSKVGYGESSTTSQNGKNKLQNVVDRQNQEKAIVFPERNKLQQEKRSCKQKKRKAVPLKKLTKAKPNHSQRHHNRISTAMDCIQIRKQKKQENPYSDDSKCASPQSVLCKMQNENFSFANQVNSQVFSQNESSIIPSLSTIRQLVIPHQAIVCSLCHLPANFFPGIGDLYGPYKPSSQDVMDNHDKAQNDLQLDFDCFHSNTSDLTRKSEMRFEDNVCYITSNGLQSDVGVKPSTATPTVRSTNESISRVSHWLRMLQSVDNVLFESNKKHSHSGGRHKNHIPGFTGAVVLPKVSSAKDQPPPKDPVLPKVDSIVFVEQPLSVGHKKQSFPKRCSQSVSTMAAAQLQRQRKSSRHTCLTEDSRDKTVVQVCHHLDTRELWVHAMCAVWSPGIYAVQNQVFGIASTVKSASLNTCELCRRPGASISNAKNPQHMYHYPCAVSAKMNLTYRNFMVGD